MFIPVKDSIYGTIDSNVYQVAEEERLGPVDSSMLTQFDGRGGQ